MFESFQVVTLLTLLTRLLVGAYPQWQGCAPSRTQRIYFANHSSHMDAIVIWSSLPAELRAKTRPVAAKDYWEKGALRRRIAIKELKVVLIDRHHTAHANPLDPLIQALHEGSSLIIFPEGTRNKGEELSLLPFHNGSFKIAEKTGCPIIPMSLNNTCDIFEGHFPFIKKTHVILEYGKPIYPKELDKDEKKRIGEYCSNIISETIHKNQALV